jgi:hypothetical protein
MIEAKFLAGPAQLGFTLSGGPQANARRPVAGASSARQRRVACVHLRTRFFGFERANGPGAERSDFKLLKVDRLAQERFGGRSALIQSWYHDFIGESHA